LIARYTLSLSPLIRNRVEAPDGDQPRLSTVLPPIAGNMCGLVPLFTRPYVPLWVDCGGQDEVGRLVPER
jgi:hypothetical protein